MRQCRPRGRLRDRLLARLSAGLLATGLLFGSPTPAVAATTVSISAPAVGVDTVRIQGAVSGSSSGATVLIQQYTGGSWKNAAQTTVNSARKYVVKVPVPVGGHTFRAKASGSKIATGYSTSVKVNGVTHPGMILYETNAQRRKQGLPALKPLGSLSKLAQAWTQWMYDNTSLTHHPDYVAQYPGSPKAGAANIANGVGDALTSKNVVDAWMNSPGHRANILGNYTHIGVGWVSQGGTAYATQNFALY